MRATEDGIELSKPELAALLEFAASRSHANQDLASVVFRVAHDRCWAYASDGATAVEADGVTDERCSLRGEWGVRRELLESAVKLAAKATRIVLPISGRSLHGVILEDEEPGDEDREPRVTKRTIEQEDDAVLPQQSLPSVERCIKLPSGTRAVKAFTLSSHYLARLALVGKACGRAGADIFVPSSLNDPTHVRIGAGEPTVWTVLIMPMASDADATADEVAQEDHRKRETRATSERERLEGLVEETVERANAGQGAAGKRIKAAERALQKAHPGATVRFSVASEAKAPKRRQTAIPGTEEV